MSPKQSKKEEVKTGPKEILDVYEFGEPANSYNPFHSEENSSRDAILPPAPKGLDYDPVHLPQHYQTDKGFQAIDVIEAFKLNYRLGNVCKYILRANNKHETPKEDLFKSFWYLAREIKSQGYDRELKEFFEKQLKEIK